MRLNGMQRRMLSYSVGKVSKSHCFYCVVFLFLTLFCESHTQHVRIDFFLFLSHTVLAKGFMAKEDIWPQESIDYKSLSLPVERGSDEWRLQRIQKAYCHPENYRRRDLAVKLASLSNLNLAQIAMLYPLTKGKHISVIFGSSNKKHVEDMMALQHLRINDVAMDCFENKEVQQKNNIVAFSPKKLLEDAAAASSSSAETVVAMTKKKESNTARNRFFAVRAFSSDKEQQ